VEQHLAAVRHLSGPSVVGVLSISPAVLTTASGLLAPVIGGGHSLRTFIMEGRAEEPGSGRLHFARYTVSERPLGPGARSWAIRNHGSAHTIPIAARTGRDNEQTRLASRDLRAIDLLFCDSITYGAVNHARRMKYRLLSDESLREITSSAESLIPHPRRKK